MTSKKVNLLRPRCNGVDLGERPRYGGGQYAEYYRAAMFGLGFNLGDFGAISFDATQAKSTLADQSEHKGQSYRFLYAKTLNRLGTNFQLMGYRYSTSGFYTLFRHHV